MLSDEERASRKHAGELLRAVRDILKRAGISQNDIARQAHYSSGYLPQLLKDDEAAEKLSPPCITNLTTAMWMLSLDAALRLDDQSRIDLRRALDTLRARYGETRQDVIGPGENLTPRAANYLHRRIDNLLAQELLNHDDLNLIGLTGPPGAGKTWALQRLGFNAATTHEVCAVDLSYDQAGSHGRPEVDENAVPRLVLRGLRRNLRRLCRSTRGDGDPGALDDLSGSLVDTEDIAKALGDLVAVSAEQDKRLLVTIDGVDRATEAFRLVRLMRQLQTDRWDYEGLDRVLVMLAGTIISDSRETLQSSGIRPAYPLSYLSDVEVRTLFELWQAAGDLRHVHWADLEREAALLAGHPKLVCQLMETCRIAGTLVTATRILQPGEPGWLVLKGHFERFATECRRRTAGPAERLASWLDEGRVIVTDNHDLILKSLVKQYGLATADDDLVVFLVNPSIAGDLHRILLASFDSPETSTA